MKRILIGLGVAGWLLSTAFVLLMTWLTGPTTYFEVHRATDPTGRWDAVIEGHMWGGAGLGGSGVELYVVPAGSSPEPSRWSAPSRSVVRGHFSGTVRWLAPDLVVLQNQGEAYINALTNFWVSPDQADTVEIVWEAPAEAEAGDIGNLQ